jgi:soluble epoxide hydrolase/lipid-phosphate phosphatase
MLGYGGTDKPLDTKAFAYDLITKDIVEIFDAESLNQAIAIGHDWCVN